MGSSKSLVFPAPPKLPASPRFRRTGWRTASLVVAVLLFCWLAWYVYTRGFGRPWRSLLEREFARYGLAIDVRRLTLDPFRGLIARDVQILDSKGSRTILAEINTISLDLNIANLLNHAPALNAVDLRGARVSFPIDLTNPKSERVRITDFQAKIYFSPGRIEIRQASGKFYGLRLNATATIVNPEQISPAIVAEERDQDPADETIQFLAQILRELRATRFPGPTPELSFGLQINLAQSNQWRLENGHISAPALQRGDYGLHDLVADFGLEGQRLVLRRLHVSDDHGELFATGNWDLASGEKRFQVRSSLDLAELLQTDPRVPWAQEWKFIDPPTIEADGIYPRNRELQVYGRAEFGAFEFRDVPFLSLEAGFAYRNGSWMVTNAEVSHRTGTFAGDLLVIPNQLRVRLHSSCDPNAFAPLLPAGLAVFGRDWDFQTPPVLDLELAGTNSETLSGKGQIWLGRTRFKGETVLSGHAAFTVDHDIIASDNIQFRRDEGSSTAQATYNPRSKLLEIRDSKLEVVPQALGSWGGPPLQPMLQPFRFSGQPPETRVVGKLNLNNASADDLQINVRADAPFSYQTGLATLPFESAHADLTIKPDSGFAVQIVGRMGGGTCSLESVESSRQPGSHDWRLRFRNVDLASSQLELPLLSGYTGKLDGEVDVSRANKRSRSVIATISIQSAIVTGGPFFQPVAHQLAQLGFSSPDQTNQLSLSLRSNMVTGQLDELRLENAHHSLRLTGGCGLLSQRIDLSGEIDSPANPVQVSGTYSNPVWQMPERGLR
jgi:hypothetical protein